MGRKDREATVARLKENQPEDDAVEPTLVPAPQEPIQHMLKEVESLRIKNLSLQQELLISKQEQIRQEGQRLQGLLGGVLDDVRSRLGLSDDVLLELDPGMDHVIQMPEKKAP